MNKLFVETEWNERPPEAKRLIDGRVIVTKDVVEENTDEGVIYRGKSAVMSELMFAAYAGAKAVTQKREQEIYDETVEELIKEGVI